MVAENKPGATGNIGAEFVAKSAARRLHAALRRDLVQHHAGAAEALPFDPVKSFAPVALIATSGLVVRGAIRRCRRAP